MHPRPRPVLLVLLALAIAAPAARADTTGFTPVRLPAPGRVEAFAASGTVWIAAMLSDDTGTATLWRTADGGASWQQLDLQTDQDVRASVGPDGAFYVTAGPRLLRYDAAGGPGQDLPYGMTSQQGTLAAPAWDPQGRMWVELVDTDNQGNSTLRVARVENGAAVDAASVSDASATFSLELDPKGPTVFASDGGQTFRKDGAALVKVADNAGVPMLTAGDLTFFEGGVSEDGGQTVSTDGGFPALAPVHGSSDLFLDTLSGEIVTRFSDWLLRPSALVAPPESDTAWMSGPGIVVATRPSADHPAIAFHAGAVPAAPAAIGKPSASSRRMVARVNSLRRAAGFPPLIDDAGIARAADNHSAYWTRNPFPRQVLDLHHEQRGRPGFTGVDPSDRCKAVGAVCGGEVIYPGRREAAAALGWTATTFHGVIMRPLYLLAGGAVHGPGPAVMEVQAGNGLQLAPKGYPAGHYTGPLGFAGEAPDPGASCKDGHASQPYGTSIRVYIPTGGLVEHVSLKRSGGGSVRGCQVSDSFLPDDPLRPHTKYVATATWRIGFEGKGKLRSFSWSFRT